jgi:hypothetical protein
VTEDLERLHLSDRQRRMVDAAVATVPEAWRSRFLRAFVVRLAEQPADGAVAQAVNLALNIVARELVA